MTPPAVLARAWVPALFLLLAAYPFLPVASAIRGEQVTILLVYALLALGLNVVVGYTGLLHLGIAAFFAIGAYSVAVLTSPVFPLQFSVLTATAVGVALAAAVGVATAAPTLRLRGDYLALVTLGFGLITLYAIRNLDNITLGTSGITLVDPRPFPWSGEADARAAAGKDKGDLPSAAAGKDMGGLRFAPSWGTRWYNYPYLYFVALAVLGGAMLFLRNLERSRLGRAWVALREDELAAACMGLNPATLKLAAIALGGGLAGLAGALFAVAQRTTGNPQAFDFTLSMIMVCCLILGGLGNRAGVILGVVLLMGFDRILTPILDNLIQEQIGTGGKSYLKVSGWKLMIFGVALILMMRFRPEGLLPAARMRHELHPDEAGPDGPVAAVPPDPHPGTAPGA